MFVSSSEHTCDTLWNVSIYHPGSLPPRLVGPPPRMSAPQYFYCNCCSPVGGAITQPIPVFNAGSPYTQVTHTHAHTQPPPCSPRRNLVSSTALCMTFKAAYSSWQPTRNFPIWAEVIYCSCLVYMMCCLVLFFTAVHLLKLWGSQDSASASKLCTASLRLSGTCTRAQHTS